MTGLFSTLGVSGHVLLVWRKKLKEQQQLKKVAGERHGFLYILLVGPYKGSKKKLKVRRKRVTILRIW